MKPTIDKGRVTLHLTQEEVRLIHQALNEVCNGVDFTDAEFASRLGADRAEAVQVMQMFGHVYGLFGKADIDETA